MAAVLTALAINMKITPLSNLQRFENDSLRLEMADYMVSIGVMTKRQKESLSSYFGKYWTCFDYYKGLTI
jgi:hypothetical protein